MLHCLAFIAEVTVDRMDHAIFRLDYARVVKRSCRLLLQMPGRFPRQTFVRGKADGELISAGGCIVMNEHPVAVVESYAI